MSKEVISTTNAPAAIGPYSQAIKAGGFLFISGQIPLDPAYAKYFAENAPARSCVEVGRLPKDVLVEVEAIAVCK